MRSFPCLGLAALLALLAAPAALAGDIQIQPGKWETTVTTTISILPQPRVTTRTECMTEEKLDPEKWMSEQAGDCDFENVETTSSTMEFELSCKTPQGTATGKGSYRVDGDTLTGSFSMTIQGQMSLTMDNAIKSRRVGDC